MKATHARTPANQEPASPAPPRHEWLTRLAMVLALCLVIARACMIESIRAPFSMTPSAADVRAPGVTTSLALDMLCCLPLLLVLLRRALDPTFRLHLAWPHLFMGLLAAWAMLSTFWADDKFVAIVGGFHFVSAFAILLAATQLFSNWRRLRILAAVCCGLLLIYIANGMYYRFLDLPDLQRDWREHRVEHLRAHGIDENSYRARQFGLKIENGDMVGFNTSPNSYAAMLCLFSIVTLGLLVQRQCHRDGRFWMIPFAIALGLAIWVMYYTHSKAAFATLILGAVVLGLNRILRKHFASHWRKVYLACLVGFLIAAGVLITHGLRHGTLFNDSLTFRWKYWVASAHMFAERSLVGTGWNNFGQHYLAHRLPDAAEEIKDPHNFLVRTFVELGVFGGLLTISWMIAFWWTLSRPVLPPEDDGADMEGLPPRSSIVWRIVLIAGLAMAINLFASVDLSASSAFVFLELIKRTMYFLLLFAGVALSTIRSMQRQEIDGRQSPWIVHAILIALGLFLIHNLIDFSLFEIGPMFVFALIAGAALSIRLTPPTKPSNQFLPRAAAIGVTILWLAALGLVIPIAYAEDLAHDGDTELRAGRIAQAAGKYAEAFAAVPYNADYAYRAAHTMLRQPPNLAEVQSMISRAIQSNPSDFQALLLRARIELMQPDQFPAARADFDRAIVLNPNDVDIRLDYASALSAAGLRAEARAQYQAALDANDRLNSDEPKRLPPARLQEIRAAIEQVK